MNSWRAASPDACIPKTVDYVKRNFAVVHVLYVQPEVLGFRVQGPGFRVQGSGCRVQGLGFRVQGFGFPVSSKSCTIKKVKVRFWP